MYFIIMVKCVNAFIVVVKCGIGNHTAFPMLTGGSHYRGHGPVSYEHRLCCVQYPYVFPSIDLGVIAGLSESVCMHTFV